MPISLVMTGSNTSPSYCPEELLDFVRAERAAGRATPSVGFAGLRPQPDQAHSLTTNQKAYRKPGDDAPMKSWGMTMCTTIIVTGKLYFGTCAYMWHVPSGNLNVATLEADLTANAFPYAKNQWVCTLVACEQGRDAPVLQDQVNMLTQSGVRDENILTMFNSSGCVGLGPNRELRYG
jgi:hypothetical protein